MDDYQPKFWNKFDDFRYIHVHPNKKNCNWTNNSQKEYNCILFEPVNKYPYSLSNARFINTLCLHVKIIAGSSWLSEIYDNTFKNRRYINYILHVSHHTNQSFFSKKSF